jgi:glycosyltransferase involved in cell wall biosynthesis
MTTVRVLTLVTPATLPQARVLADSLHRHQPEWLHEVVVIAPDGWSPPAQDEQRQRPQGARPRIRSAAAVLNLDLDPSLGRHEESQLQMLLLPRLLRRCAQESEGPLLHLPPTAWVLGGLQPLAELVSEHGVMLAARVQADIPDDGLDPSNARMAQVGRMTSLLMGVDGTARGVGFLEWWSAHVEATLGSLDGLNGGLRPEDRPWLARLLELAPARFAAAVLEDPGCNLSMWNLHDHVLGLRADGQVMVDESWPLRFIDLAGFEPDHPFRLSPEATRVRVSRSPALAALCRQYAKELTDAGWQADTHRHNVGRSMPNGLIYDAALHKLHLRALALGETFADVFAVQGAEAFAAWLAQPAPQGASHGISRYVFYRVAHERPDVMRAYPDLNGRDGAGYVAWCWAFGLQEMALSERFMPPPPGAEAEGDGREVDECETRATGTLGVRATGTPGVGSQTADGHASGPSVDVPAPGVDAPAPGGHSSAPAPGESCPAVRVTGYLGHTLGLGAAARGYVQALSAAGVPTSTATVPLHHLELPVELDEGYGRQGFEELVHDGRHGYEVVAVNADELPGFVERLGEDYFQGPRIGIWGWETNSIPARWAQAFALVQEIWVYSRFMAHNIGAVAPVPTIALPPPVCPPSQAAAPVRLGVPDGFLFLFAFDYMSTIQRKNPVGLIEAFKRAFAPGEGPRLLLKTINAPLRPLAEEEVLWAAGEREDIHVIDCSLSSSERDGLMAACDCYVSLHRSEGFGLTLAEAMAIGKPVIGTGYSGNMDFMNAQNSYLVEYELGRVGPDCEIYPADGEWAQPSVEHAVTLMRRVYERPEEARRVGERAREEIARQLSPQATGAAMRGRLEELEAAHGWRQSGGG